MRLATSSSTSSGTADRGLHATAQHPLPFDPSVTIRAFALERDDGNVLLYGAPGAGALAASAAAGRAYFNHWHDALFGEDLPAVPLFVHEADSGEVAARGHTVRATFSRRHTLDDDLDVIPTPGHTPGATAFLWDSGEHRLLFTGDSLYLRDGEWVAAVLDSSDRAAYLDSLELVRELDFDVLVPWAASAGEPYLAFTTPGETRRRIDAILRRLRRGESR
jgi:glyoxylase-like metal-dependent hydrolase (beta-lactamase superfamily II)